MAKTCTVPPKVRKELKRYKSCMVDAERDYRRAVDKEGLRAPASRSFLDPCRLKLSDNLKRRGLEWVGMGAYRTTYAFNGCVAKIAWKKESIEDNEKEITLSRSLPTKIKKYFNPITDYDRDGWWVAMPRVRTKERTEEEQFSQVDPDRLQTKLRNALMKRGFVCDDLNRGNVGETLDGKPVIIDYGLGFVQCPIEYAQGFPLRKEKKPQIPPEAISSLFSSS